MEKEKHDIDKGYYYNYIQDASHCYWAARILELNKSLDEKDKMVDELIVRRLRQRANSLLEQAMGGFDRMRSLPEDQKAKEMAEMVSLITKRD